MIKKAGSINTDIDSDKRVINKLHRGATTRKGGRTCLTV
jgi:hypothetical protein